MFVRWIDNNNAHMAMASKSNFAVHQSVHLSLGEGDPDLCSPKQLLPSTASYWKQNYHRLPVQLSPPAHFDSAHCCCLYQAAATSAAHFSWWGCFHINSINTTSPGTPRALSAQSHIMTCRQITQFGPFRAGNVHVTSWNHETCSLYR